MNETKNNILLLLGAVLIFAGIAGGYGFLFYSMKGKIEGANEVLSRAEDFENAQGTLSRTLAFLKESELGRTRVEARFIKEHDVALFARQIEALGAQSGTILSIESLEPGVDFRKKPVLNFRIKAEGTFASVMRVEELLENFPARFDVSALRLVRTDNSQRAVVAGASKSVPASRAPVWELNATISALNFIKE